MKKLLLPVLCRPSGLAEGGSTSVVIKQKYSETPPAPLDFGENPFLVVWEVTRSCALKCIHCRAEAVEERSPDELTTAQAFLLLDEIRRFGKPVVVLTGGDPLKRPDIAEIVSHGARGGLRMTLTPSGTKEVTDKALKQLKERGLARLAVSLDGSNAELHDAFRQVKGSYEWTLNIVRWANEIGLPVQINTTVSRHNLEDMNALWELIDSFTIALWSIFFLVPMGRAKLEDEPSGRDYEKVFHQMLKLSEKSSFEIKSTEAPHYRRFLLQRGKSNPKNFFSPAQTSFANPDGIGRPSKGVNDGKGFVFVSHTGEIYPSGFLPLSAGNVKEDSLVRIYRESDLFKRIRDEAQLNGKCGVCEYRSICGGSRSRAFSIYGDYMAPDPFCVYVPKSYPITEEEKRYW